MARLELARVLDLGGDLLRGERAAGGELGGEERVDRRVRREPERITRREASSIACR